MKMAAGRAAPTGLQSIQPPSPPYRARFRSRSNPVLAHPASLALRLHSTSLSEVALIDRFPGLRMRVVAPIVRVGADRPISRQARASNRSGFPRLSNPKVRPRPELDRGSAQRSDLCRPRQRRRPCHRPRLARVGGPRISRRPVRTLAIERSSGGRFPPRHQNPPIPSERPGQRARQRRLPSLSRVALSVAATVLTCYGYVVSVKRGPFTRRA